MHTSVMCYVYYCYNVNGFVLPHAENLPTHACTNSIRYVRKKQVGDFQIMMIAAFLLSKVFVLFPKINFYFFNFGSIAS